MLTPERFWGMMRGWVEGWANGHAAERAGRASPWAIQGLRPRG